jgi:hypothetical protein
MHHAAKISTVPVGLLKPPSVQIKILPGLRMLFGSNTRLIACMYAISSGERV